MEEGLCFRRQFLFSLFFFYCVPIKIEIQSQTANPPFNALIFKKIVVIAMTDEQRESARVVAAEHSRETQHGQIERNEDANIFRPEINIDPHSSLSVYRVRARSAHAFAWQRCAFGSNVSSVFVRLCRYRAVIIVHQSTSVVECKSPCDARSFLPCGCPSIGLQFIVNDAK